MLQYPAAEIWDEITYLAYHLHWSLNELLDLEHHDRRRLVESVAALNQRAWDQVREQL